jgi:hypothetical protein
MSLDVVAIIRSGRTARCGVCKVLLTGPVRTCCGCESTLCREHLFEHDEFCSERRAANRERARLEREAAKAAELSGAGPILPYEVATEPTPES